MIIALLIILVASPLLVLPSKAFPGDKPAIVVEPASIQNTNLTSGSTFLVNVSLYNATLANVPAGIAGVEVQLSWDNSVIQPLSFVDRITTSGGVLQGQEIVFGVRPAFFDNSNTKISSPPYTNATNFHVAAASTSGPWWGDGTIVTINFTVLTVGSTGLNLIFTDLIDLNSNLVDRYIQDGFFSNIAAPPPPPPATIYVDPGSIINSLLTPPSSIRVNVSIGNAVNLTLFSFSLGFNSSVLQATSATWNWNGSAVGLLIDNTAGIISGSTSISPPITGYVPLVVLQFDVTGLGESTLHLFGLTLFDNHDYPVPINVTRDGYFNNMLVTSIYVDPPLRMDPTLQAGNTTTFAIMAQNFVNVGECNFDLRFNPNVIKIVSYTITNPIEGSFIDFEILSYNNTVGDLSVIFYYSPPLSVASSPIMNITFILVGYGISPLNLNSTSLNDPLGNPISHQTADGLLITVINDVAITDIEPTPLKVYPGRIITVNVTAANLGNLTETFTVSAYVDGENASLGTQTVTSLAPGANTTLAFYWNTTGQPMCSLHTLSANASFVPFEFNLTNNFLVGSIQAKIKLLGDINSDGTVNLQDLVLMAAAYNTKVGDLKYNPEADFNNDGKINLVDLVTCALYYGQSCPNDP
jgi:hypothetical protein